LPVVEEGEEYIEVIDVGPRHVPSTCTTTLKFTPQASGTSTHGSISLTKSLRTIRRRRLSDFHFEPLYKRRKLGKNFTVVTYIDNYCICCYHHDKR
jgi:hypothetical protein